VSRIGGLLLFLGLGSLVLPLFNMQFRVLSFVDDYQPVLGIAFAVVGVALLVAPLVLNRRSEATVAPAAVPAAPATMAPATVAPAAVPVAPSAAAPAATSEADPTP
jgi:drug/metabolite transporter (DMT)-like permease